MKILEIIRLTIIVGITAASRLRHKDKDETDDARRVSINTITQIYQAAKFYDDIEYVHDSKLLYSPKHWIRSLETTYAQLDRNTHFDAKLSKDPMAKDIRQRAIDTYIQVLMGLLSGISYGTAERSVRFDSAVLPLNTTTRDNGEDTGYLALTMIGKKRMKNLYFLLQEILQKPIKGHLVETGVWRGGASMLIQAILHAYQAQKERNLYLCDSFRGLPSSSGSLHRGDIGWDGLRYSAVSDLEVARHFHQYGLLSDNLYFVKGYFNQTMPLLAPQLSEIALLRLDGDMYQSTVDVLYHLYEKVVVGGYIIVDDWQGFPAKDAVLDFFTVHQLKPKVIPIDRVSVYWQKTEQVKIQYWRYQQQKFREKK